jgi:methylmalonyl-CoA mutase, N-terminal domain
LHRHTQKIERFKRERNSAELCEGLDRVAVAASGNANLIPPIIAALDASATIGEIATVMRSALGMPPDVFDHPLPDGATRQRHVA